MSLGYEFNLRAGIYLPLLFVRTMKKSRRENVRSEKMRTDEGAHTSNYWM